MSLIELPLIIENMKASETDLQLVKEALKSRQSAEELFSEQRYLEALERCVASLRTLREFSNFEEPEFKALLSALLFDLAEIHFQLKDYKQSEKELDLLFKVLESLVKADADRFGKYHILAMELSTRILRSRKKALDMLVKQQINAGALYDKVNAGVSAATEKLVESLRNIGELLASAGDYRSALKFYSEAIKISKKRSGGVTRREVRMTLEMAQIMIRVNQMRPRAKRLLNAVLPHAIALETLELEQEILGLIDIIDSDVFHEPKWKTFFNRITKAAKEKFNISVSIETEEEGDTPVQDEDFNEISENVENVQKIVEKQK